MHIANSNSNKRLDPISKMSLQIDLHLFQFIVKQNVQKPKKSTRNLSRITTCVFRIRKRTKHIHTKWRCIPSHIIKFPWTIFKIIFDSKGYLEHLRYVYRCGCGISKSFGVTVYHLDFVKYKRSFQRCRHRLFSFHTFCLFIFKSFDKFVIPSTKNAHWSTENTTTSSNNNYKFSLASFAQCTSQKK